MNVGGWRTSLGSVRQEFTPIVDLCVCGKPYTADGGAPCHANAIRWGVDWYKVVDAQIDDGHAHLTIVGVEFVAEKAPDAAVKPPEQPAEPA